MLALIASSLAISPISTEAQSRRTLGRFTRGHPENSVCWDRDGVDGFISVIDAHQHPMPFGGPEVPFSTYTDWFIEHGIVFSVFMGIGQRIVKQNASLPDCCYYLHCPTYAYPVIPMTESDELNAEARLEHYYGKVDHKLHLTLSATFPNLQRSAGAKQMMQGLWNKWPQTFKWTGEINVFKHALAGNGFFSDFTGPRLTVARIEAGELDEFFSIIGPAQPNGEHIPAATLHSDIGCDTYAKSIPAHAGDGVHDLVCECSKEEKLTAQKDAWWWKKVRSRRMPHHAAASLCCGMLRNAVERRGMLTRMGPNVCGRRSAPSTLASSMRTTTRRRTSARSCTSTSPTPSSSVTKRSSLSG